MKIVKQTSGLVTIIDPKGAYASRNFSNSDIQLRSDNETFEIWQAGKPVYSFQFSDVESTQIAPDAAIVPTSVSALLSTLQTSFFFEVAGGGGVGDKLFLFQNFN